MHSQKLIHRDISPENILVLDGNQIKICDLGIASVGGHSVAFAGKQGYIAPEVA